MIIIDCILSTMYVVLLGCVLYSINKFQIDKLKRDSKPINRVHFYVARDKNDGLFLYIGKPIRCNTYFISINSVFMFPCNTFNYFGLNESDFDNLKWEDEPLEVFVNMED